MKIFSDYHHGGLFRSLLLTLQHRLGHEVYAPKSEFAEWANTISGNGSWLTPEHSHPFGIPEQYVSPSGGIKNVVSREEFLSTDWDAVIISRPESLAVYQNLFSQHPNSDKIKRIGQAGNEGQTFPWGQVKNFLSSDYLSYIRAPKEVNKIHYMQELGMQYGEWCFTPLTEESLKTVNTYINCFSSFNNWHWDKDQSWWGGKCPHCDGVGPTGDLVNIYEIWNVTKDMLPELKFKDYGMTNTMGMVQENELPTAIKGGSLCYGFKPYDGFGHSISQSISLGRLCIVPRRFHRYRTANQFLIPNLTCLEAEPTIAGVHEAISWFTSSLERANILSEACFMAAKSIFNWEKEAYRVKDFLDKLQ